MSRARSILGKPHNILCMAPETSEAATLPSWELAQWCPLESPDRPEALSIPQQPLLGWKSSKRPEMDSNNAVYAPPCLLYSSFPCRVGVEAYALTPSLQTSCLHPILTKPLAQCPDQQQWSGDHWEQPPPYQITGTRGIGNSCGENPKPSIQGQAHFQPKAWDWATRRFHSHRPPIAMLTPLVQPASM